jgi:hypothetical protein
MKKELRITNYELRPPNPLENYELQSAIYNIKPPNPFDKGAKIADQGENGIDNGYPRADSMKECGCE